MQKMKYEENHLLWLQKNMLSMFTDVKNIETHPYNTKGNDDEGFIKERKKLRKNCRLWSVNRKKLQSSPFLLWWHKFSSFYSMKMKALKAAFKRTNIEAVKLKLHSINFFKMKANREAKSAWARRNVCETISIHPLEFAIYFCCFFTADLKLFKRLRNLKKLNRD